MNRILLAALLAGTTMPMGSAAYAQSADDAASDGDAIIVTARRVEENLQDVPISISALGAADLAEQQIGTEFDLQRATPGLTIRQNGSANQFNYSIRGQSVDTYTNSPPGVLAYTNEAPTKKLNGRVEYIVKNVNNEGFTNILCTFDQVNISLMQGQYMNAEIESQNRDAWAIANDAIVRFEGKEYIFVKKENGEYEMTKVEIGNRVGDFTQIIDYQIYKNKKIVTTGAYTLLMKMKNVAE